MEGEGGAAGGLSVYQQIALGVLAAFFRDDFLVSSSLSRCPYISKLLRWCCCFVAAILRILEVIAKLERGRMGGGWSAFEGRTSN